MTGSMYHVVLRTSALTLALILLFDSGLLSPLTRQLSQNTQHYLAQAVGMYASVQPTDLNQMTAELTARQRELDQRERELQIGLADAGNQTSIDSTFVLSVLVFILLVLIVLNYILDYLRATPPKRVALRHERLG